MRNTWWKSGQWNALCDVCGMKFKSTELRARWDGLMVCEQDWETRHPQELIRPIQDQNKLPWTRPEPQDTFIFVPICTAKGTSAVPGDAEPGCAIPGYLSPNWFPGPDVYASN